MNFRSKTKDEPEINLIPFIDVLLVVLIFLMLSTTYSKLTEMQLKLPVANTEAQREYPKEVVIAITADGSYSVGGLPLSGRTLESLANALADQAKAHPDTVLIIHADANAKHQSIITVMEAARRVGMNQITFATQSSHAAGS